MMRNNCVPLAVLLAAALVCQSASAIQTGGNVHGRTDGHFFDIFPWGSEKYWIFNDKYYTDWKATTNAFVVNLSGAELSHLMQYEYVLTDPMMTPVFTLPVAQVQSFAMTLTFDTPADMNQLQVRLTDYHITGAGGFEITGPATGWDIPMTLTGMQVIDAGNKILKYSGNLQTLGMRVNVPGYTTGVQTVTSSDPVPFEFEFAVVVPEPGTALLAAVGAAVFGVRRRPRTR